MPVTTDSTRNGKAVTNLVYSRAKKAPSPVVGLRNKKIIAFGWYGGKFSHLDWLLPLLPPCHHYCEPFLPR
jgi:DNA adenine methylase